MEHANSCDVNRSNKALDGSVRLSTDSREWAHD
jgi:hypothetical protein